MSDLQFDDYEPIGRLPDSVCLELGRLIAAFANAEWQLVSDRNYLRAGVTGGVTAYFG